ncbi:c-type cytochrome biogenesis protein CcmI [uncultured Endozoicomonas sp.]|uniref:c-type cytochrome biogenesis protein CcmI n=1 Tax=uncultured Endozoicomonas sp. TaxID=432652 RepID=UPI002626E5C3|nr:c-type cytochrome biogenesis protein CcmI [uncultured Endozoicomonas sp.]
MMAFWLISLVMITAAVLLAAWPLLKSRVTEPQEQINDETANILNFKEQIADLDSQVDQGLLSKEEGDRLKLELKKKLAEELENPAQASSRYSKLKQPAVAVMIAVLIPALAILLYFRLGASTEMAVIDVMEKGDHSSEQIEQILESWVEKRPENNQALFMLGSHYMRTGKMDEALKTYRTLVRVSNGHPQVTAELAQVLFLASNNVITPEVRQLYQQTLSKDGENTTALGLQGIDAFSNGQYQEAVTAWQTALRLEMNPTARQSLTAGINQAKTMLGETVVSIRVQVALSDELKDLPETARVIVFARVSDQPGSPPVAAIPMRLTDLPGEIVLDDSSAMMMGGQSLSSLDKLDITARLSLSGDVMTPDYQVHANGVNTDYSDPVRLVIAPAG